MTTRLKPRTSHLLVLVLIATPILMIAGLMLSLEGWIRSGSPMADATPVGAGAGVTGGANAIGELLAGHKANASAMPDRSRSSDPDHDPDDRQGARPPRSDRPVIADEAIEADEPAEAAPLGVDPYRTLDVTGTVRRLQVAGGAGRAMSTTRDLLVWLPPGYGEAANADRVYPVLYLMDGQNLFEKLPGVRGEWHADEVALELVELGLIEPLVIVGVPHAGAGRTEEYVPLGAMDTVEPAGGAFVAWLVDEVMPRVESTVRVSTDPADTGIGGASLGAVISAYAAGEHPGRFGALLLESMPTMPGSRSRWTAYLEGIEDWPGRVFVGMGAREASNDLSDEDLNAVYVDWARRLDAMLESRGLGPERRLVIVAPGANHNEDAWARRLPDALQFLFPPKRE